MATKGNGKIKINFKDAISADEVVGSCYHIEMGRLQFLVDCGAYQGADVLTEYKVNSRKYHFSAKRLDFVLLTHAHMDHSGQIPKLFKDGFRGTVYVPTGCYRLLRSMWKDIAYINVRNAEYLTKRYGKNYKPLYDEEDVENALAHIEELDFGKYTDITDGVSVKLYRAGHIPASAQIELELSNNNYKKRVVFTGDIGSKNMKKYYTDPMEEIPKCNILIGETTYGDPSRHSITMKDREKDMEKIKTVVHKTCIEDKSKVIIPVFALDRTLEVLSTLYEIYHEDKSFSIPILIDSKLGLQYIKDYFNILDEDKRAYLNKVVNWQNVCQIEEYTVSKAHQESNKPEIVLASSGMMNAGRIIGYMEHFVNNQYAHVLFCGYCSEHTLAAQIKDIKNKYIKINDKSYRNRINITSLNSFSSHASHDCLLDYYSTMEVNEKIILVHGNMDGKLKFSRELQEKISEKNCTTKVLVANSSMTLNI